MFTVKNYSNLINNDEIKKCLNMLNKKHRNLNAHIIFFKSKWQVLWKYLFFSECTIQLNFEELIEMFKCQTSGCHYHIKTTDGEFSQIYIYPFNYNKSKRNYINKLNIIQTLFHEIRHA